MAIISIVETLALIKPHNIGDKIYYINRYGFVRRGTILDIKILKSQQGTILTVDLKIRGEENLYSITLYRNMPNRIYANRDRAKRHAPEVIKYFQEN